VEFGDSDRKDPDLIENPFFRKGLKIRKSRSLKKLFCAFQDPNCG
jgi:hypothetical protein